MKVLVNHIKNSFDREFDLTDIESPAQYYDQFKPNVEEIFVETQYGKIHTYVAGRGN